MMEAFATRLAAWFDARVVRLQTFIRRHLGPSGDLKVLSLLVATVIYYFIQNIISFSGTYAVPLVVTVREANVAVLSGSRGRHPRLRPRGAEDAPRAQPRRRGERPAVGGSAG